MNWIDILLLVVLCVAVLWGLKTGILKALFAAIGVLVGFAIAGRFADKVGGLMGDNLAFDSIITIVAYWVIVIVVVFVAIKVGNVIRPLLVLGTLGTAGLADKIGGLALGLLIGIVVVSGVIIVLSRLAFDFTVEVPGVSIPGTDTMLIGDGQEVAAIENQRQVLVDTLGGSRVVSIFLDVRGFLPAGMLGFVPDDFGAALDVLEQQVGN